MKKKILKTILFIVLLFLIFSFWMSPRLGGILSFGKDHPDKVVEKLNFDLQGTKDFGLVYEDLSNSSELVELRHRFNLDSLVEGSKSDFEKIQKIQSWVQGQWIHDGDNTPSEYNVIAILEAAQKGERFRCVEYSFVARKCLSALGFKTRSLGLMTKDISEVKSGGGHVVNEIYLHDIDKWVFMDPQFDVIPVQHGVPLNAIELQSCISNKTDFELINPNKTVTREEYSAWIGPYLYYFKVGINGQSISIWDRIIGSKKQLTLLPIGAEKPTYFQKIFRLNNSFYTHSLSDFYPNLNEQQ